MAPALRIRARFSPEVALFLSQGAPCSVQVALSAIRGASFGSQVALFATQGASFELRIPLLTPRGVAFQVQVSLFTDRGATGGTKPRVPEPNDFHCRTAWHQAPRPRAAPITLIDGDKLIDLLIEHRIGVRKKEVELWELDLDAFADLEDDSPEG